MEKYKRIIITGAGGFIGCELVKHFQTASYEVIGLVRTIPAEKIKSIQYQVFDLEGPSLPDIFSEDSILIHCSYIKSRPKEKDFNISGTEYLVKAAEKKGAKKIFLSSISSRSGSASYYASQKNQLENLFRKKGDVILRPGLVIGRGGLFYNTMQTIKKTGTLPLIAGGRQPVYYTSIKNLLSAIDEIIQNDLSGLFIAANPKPIPFGEFYSKIASGLGIKFRTISFPLWLMKLAVFFNSFLPKPKITRDNLEGLKNTHTIDPGENTSKLQTRSSDLEEILSDLKGQSF